MGNVKKIIITLCVISIILLIMILVLNKKDTSTNEILNSNNIQNNLDTVSNMENVTNNVNVVESIPELSFNTSIQTVTSNAQLYMIGNCINKYFGFIKDNNTQAINELCENSYYSITENVKYSLNLAYITQNEFLSVYYTCGIITVANMDYEEIVYIQMYQDLQNNTYKLKIITEDEFNNKTELSQNDKKEITKDTYNTIEYANVDTVKQIEIYLEDYKFYIFNNCISKAYELLDSDYKNKRFETEENFKNYLINKQNDLKKITIIEYKINTSNTGNIYSAKDSNGNYYIINETSYMNYTIMLDNYTIMDTEKYLAYSNDNKKQYDIEVFIEMLNSYDYKNAYNLLSDTTKANFETQLAFENYVNNNFFANNIIKAKTKNDDGTYTVVLKETISTLSNTITKNFTIDLLNNTNFIISFDI